MIAPIAGGTVRQDCGGWNGGTLFADENSMGDVDSELAMAARHVADARCIVARQRARIVKLKALRRATLDHQLTLDALVSTLALMESHAQVLAETAKRLGHLQRMLS
jgi:hypothetical protein